MSLEAPHQIGASEFVAVMQRFGLTRRRAALLISLSVLSIGIEALGIGTLLPIFEMLRRGKSNAEGMTGPIWSYLRDLGHMTGVPLTLGALLGFSFAFLLGRQVFQYLSLYYGGVMSRRLADKVRRRAFTDILRADSAIQLDLRAGEIGNDLTVELDRALRAMFAVLGIFTTAIKVSVYVAGLFVLSTPVTLLSIAIIGITGFLMRGMMAKVRETGRAISAANSDLAGFLIERIPRVRLIRLSATERAESAEFAKLSHRQAQETMLQKFAAMKIILIPEPVAIGFGYLVIFVGSQIFGLGLDRLALFGLVLIRLMPLVKTGLTTFNVISGNWASLERLDSRLSAIASAREQKGGDRQFADIDREIRYDHVSFNYPDRSVPALDDVSAVMPAHRMTALVGPSGAGKSTMVDLLPRLRDPVAGTIRFDGVAITEFSTESLRAGIAFVPQQPLIFNISAAEHIRYGKEAASDAEVREAARLAGALKFIEVLPDGFDTKLGDGGKRLSGGQRQRLDIARALVRRAPILILDEPTGALDADAEAAFREALQTLRAETNLTIIVIAHRLSTIADAEQILVLKEGRVEAAGTHARLMAAGGWYAEAIRKQFGGAGERPSHQSEPVA